MYGPMKAEYSRRYREKNREKLRVYNNAYNTTHRERLRINKRSRMYGIPHDEVLRLESESESRGMKCPICDVVMHRGGKHDYTSEVFDHIHGVDGYVHGLICHACNLAEGHLSRLSPEAQDRLVAYIKAKRAKQKAA